MSEGREWKRGFGTFGACGETCVWGSRHGGWEVIYACATSKGPGRKISEMREGAIKRYSHVGLDYSLFESVTVFMHYCSMSLTLLRLGTNVHKICAYGGMRERFSKLRI